MKYSVECAFTADFNVHVSIDADDPKAATQKAFDQMLMWLNAKVFSNEIGCVDNDTAIFTICPLGANVTAPDGTETHVDPE